MGASAYGPSFGGSTFVDRPPRRRPHRHHACFRPVLQPHVLHHPPARAPRAAAHHAQPRRGGTSSCSKPATPPRPPPCRAMGPPPLGPSQPGPGSSPSSSDGGIGTIGSMGGDESFKGSEQGGFYGGDESFSKKPDDYQSSTLMNENEDENTEDDFEEFARAVLLGNPGPSPPTSPPWALAGIAGCGGHEAEQHGFRTKRL